MSLIQALLVTLVAIIATVDYNGPVLCLYRPLPLGAMVGLVLGDLKQGVIIGATLELMWLGVTAVGGYTPPDTISGAIVGTALGIVSGYGVEAAIAIAVSVAVVTQQLDVIAKTLDIYFVKKADKDAEVGELNSIPRYHYSSLLIIVLFKIVPIFVALLLGGNYVKSLFDAIPPVIMTALNVAGSMLPAVGFAMLLSTMLKGRFWAYLFIGFALSAFLELPTIGLAIFGLSLAFLYEFRKNEPNTQVTIQNDDQFEEEYDL